jgi:hypothetical protein
MTTPADKLPDISITPEQWQIVAAILQKYVPDKEVWAFGSRITHKKNSIQISILQLSATKVYRLACLPQLNMISLNRICYLK